MALISLVMLAIVLFGFLGATLRSRARQEKKSIAGFHERMGQLSGVVQSENQPEPSGHDQNHDLFGNSPTHVKVIGISSKAESSSNRRINARPSSRSSARSRNQRAVSSNSTSQDDSRVSPQLALEDTKSNSETNGVANSRSEISNKPVRSSSGNKRKTASNLSSSTRTSRSKARTEVLHFEDGVVDPNMSSEPITDSNTGVRSLGKSIRGYERKANTKVLAAASIIAVVGIGTIVYALSNTSSPTSNRSNAKTVTSKTSSTKTNTSKPKTTSTTSAPTQNTGVLTPSSANSAGAVYFINSSSINLVINASKPSWVEESVTQGSTVLWEGTIPAGGSKTLSLNSSMWIRTGNVGALTITANGRPVKFSAPPGVYDFTFQQGVKA